MVDAMNHDNSNQSSRHDPKKKNIATIEKKN